MDLLPIAVGGHCVTSHRMLSVGCNHSRLVHSVTPFMVSSVAVQESLTSLFSSGTPAGAPSEGKVAEYAVLENAAEETISFLCVHPSKDVLCVGTRDHGLYVTKASQPRLCAETRLPLEVSGERTFCGCFLSVPASSQSRSQSPREEDVLVFSSTFLEKKGPHPHRLSLFALGEKSLLWRGAMDPLDSVCAFPNEWSFAACASSKVSLFSLQWSSPASGQPSPQSPKSGNRSQHNKATLLSRLCSSVDDLRDAEYVQVAARQQGTERENTFIALTSNGFMVALDKESGAVVRWMDCKVSPAQSVQLLGSSILLVGSMIRFFDAESWEFQGKVKPNVSSSVVSASYLGKPLNSIFTAAVGLGRSTIALFVGSGEIALYRYGKASERDGEKGSSSSKLRFQQAYRFVPVAPSAPSRYLWARVPLHGGDRRRGGTSAETSAVDASAVARPSCLWSPTSVRVLGATLSTEKDLTVDSSCAAFHRSSATLLTYDTNSSAVVAYAAAEDWREWARMGQTDAFTCLAASPSSEMCAGFSAATGTVTAFTCTWRDGSGGSPSLVLQPSWSKAAPLQGSAQVWQILFLGTKLYGATARSLVDFETGEEHSEAANLVKACPVGRDLVMLFRDRCTYYVPDTREQRLLAAVPANAGDDTLIDVCYEPICDLVGVCTRRQVSVVRLLDAAVVCTVRHGRAAADGSDSGSAAVEQGPSSAAVHICSADLRAGPTSVLLTVIDTLGHITEYAVLDDRIELVSRPKTPRGGSDWALPTRPVHSATASPRNDIPSPRSARNAASGRPRVAARNTPRSMGVPSPTNRPSPRSATAKPYAPATTASKATSARTRGRAAVNPKAAPGTRSQTLSVERARRQRRAVSAQGPTNRDLQSRLDALSGYYEQQKVQQLYMAPRTPRRSLTSVHAASARNMGDESDGSPPRVDSSQYSDDPRSVKDPLHFDPDDRSPPHSAERTGTREDGGAPTSIDVSALTVPTASGGVGESWGAGAGSRANGEEKEVLESRQPQTQPQPLPCDTSPTRQGDLPPDPYVPASEDVVLYSSSAGKQRPMPPQQPPSAEADASGEKVYDSHRSGSRPLRLSEQTRQLRQSIVQLNERLSAGDIGADADAEKQLGELPSLLATLAATLRQRNSRRLSGQSLGASDGTARAPDGDANSNDGSYRFLFAELERIREQNARLEAQNRTIMDRLEKPRE